MNKNQIFTNSLYLLVLIWSLNGCSSGKESSLIKIQDQNCYGCVFKLAVYNPISYEFELLDSIKLNESRNTFKLELEEPKQFHLLDGSNKQVATFFVTKKTDLTISTDKGSNKRFKGVGADLSNALGYINKLRNDIANSNTLTLEKSLFQSTLKDYINRSEEYFDSMNLSQSDRKFADAFAGLINKTLSLNYILINYDLYAGEVVMPFEELEISQESSQLELAKGLDEFYTYGSLFNDAIIYPEIWSKVEGLDNESQLTSYDSLIKTKGYGPYLENILLGFNINAFLGPQSDQQPIRELINDYQIAYPESLMAKSLELKHLNGFPLNEGDIAPKILAYDRDSVVVELTEQWDNPILIDVWASWCTPCIKQIPKILELKDRYNEKISFVFLSIDKDASKWLGADAKFLKSAPSYLISEKDFLDDYMIGAIPRYILINDSKIVALSISEVNSTAIDAYLEQLTDI